MLHKLIFHGAIQKKNIRMINGHGIVREIMNSKKFDMFHGNFDGKYSIY